MRKSIDGLCAVVKDQLNMNPSRPNAIYLFCGRRSDRIKVLLHEREGFVLLYKRLDANVGKYRWPRNRNEVKPITWRQFGWLMSGLEIEQPKAIKSTGNA
jgi:transposase